MASLSVSLSADYLRMLAYKTALEEVVAMADTPLWERDEEEALDFARAVLEAFKDEK